jgi:putative DNA primase/helicase
MNADELARALAFKRSGNQWLGRCVAHDDKNPSMIIFEGRNGSAQVRCLAGCDPIDIIEVLRERGLWGGGADPWDIDADSIGPRVDPASVDPHRNHKLAMRIWHEALDPRGTIAEIYLRGRGLVLPESCALSLVRYHPRCTKGSDVAPALIALMRNPVTFEPQAINRLFLLEDPITGFVSKSSGMMLGGSGAMMITSRHDTFWDCLSYCPQLAICEGLETGLALLNAGQRCVWALGSAGAIARFPVIFGVGHLNIFADNDEQNLDTGFVAAMDCSRRWNASSHQSASIHMPTEAGKDFADLFRAGA